MRQQTEIFVETRFLVATRRRAMQRSKLDIGVRTPAACQSSRLRRRVWHGRVVLFVWGLASMCLAKSSSREWSAAASATASWNGHRLSSSSMDATQWPSPRGLGSGPWRELLRPKSSSRMLSSWPSLRRSHRGRSGQEVAHRLRVDAALKTAEDGHVAGSKYDVLRGGRKHSTT